MEKLVDAYIRVRLRYIILLLLFVFLVVWGSSFMVVEKGLFEPNYLKLERTYNWLLSTIYQGLGAILGLLGLFSVFAWQARQKLYMYHLRLREEQKFKIVNHEGKDPTLKQLQKAKDRAVNSLKFPLVFGFVVMASSILLLPLSSLLTYTDKAVIVLIFGIMGAISTILVGVSVYITFRTTSGT